MKKKILSMIMALCLIFALVPMSAFADSTNEEYVACDFDNISIENFDANKMLVDNATWSPSGSSSNKVPFGATVTIPVYPMPGYEIKTGTLGVTVTTADGNVAATNVVYVQDGNKLNFTMPDVGADQDTITGITVTGLTATPKSYNVKYVKSNMKIYSGVALTGDGSNTPYSVDLTGKTADTDGTVVITGNVGYYVELIYPTAGDYQVIKALFGGPNPDGDWMFIGHQPEITEVKDASGKVIGFFFKPTASDAETIRGQSMNVIMKAINKVTANNGNFTISGLDFTQDKLSGDLIEFNVSADAGYKITKVAVKDTDGNIVPLSSTKTTNVDGYDVPDFKASNMQYSFRMPTSKAVINISVAPEGTQSENWINSADDSWYNDADTEFTINTPEQLAGFVKLVNAGKSFKGKTIKLGKNIDLSGKEWTAIGNLANKFEGTFNGQNNIISNMTIDDMNGDAVGLFGFTDGAVIKNVGIENSDVYGRLYVGGLVGKAKNTTIANCYVEGTLQGALNVGAIAGLSDNSTIVTCYSDCAVTAISYCGGIVGGADGWRGGTITNSFAMGRINATNNYGGLAGINYAFKITNSYFNTDATSLINDNQIEKTAAEMTGLDFAKTMNTAVPDGTVPNTTDIKSILTEKGITLLNFIYDSSKTHLILSAGNQVKINFDNSELGTQYGSSAEVLPTPTKAGFIFKGWFDNKDCTGTALTTLNGLNGEITLYALWEAIPTAPGQNPPPVENPATNSESHTADDMIALICLAFIISVGTIKYSLKCKKVK